MPADDEQRLNAGPGRETTQRKDLPADHDDVVEYVEEVDDVADERLTKRVAEQFDDQPVTPPPPPDENAQ